MKLSDFVERRSQPRGAYYGVRPTPETVAALEEFMKTHNIPNATPLDKIHCTVIYSHSPCKEPALGPLDPHWTGAFTGYNLWETNPKDQQQKTKCLTMGLDCEDLHNRHQHLTTCGAVHSYPKYQPHLTLSYDVGLDYDPSELPPYEGPLSFHEEYYEDLNTDWVNTKLNK